MNESVKTNIVVLRRGWNPTFVLNMGSTFICVPILLRLILAQTRKNHSLRSDFRVTSIVRYVYLIDGPETQS